MIFSRRAQGAKGLPRIGFSVEMILPQKVDVFLFMELLATFDITISMNRTADPYENALLESCIGTLKTEWADDTFSSHPPARTQLFAGIDNIVQYTVY